MEVQVFKTLGDSTKYFFDLARKHSLQHLPMIIYIKSFILVTRSGL